MRRTAGDAGTAVGGGPLPSDGGAHGPSPAGPRSVRLVRTAAELRDTAAPSSRDEPCLRAAVMTMGALHAGHASLIRTARERVGARGQVVVTVFVNPLQFGPSEDLDRYPRTLDADLVLAAEAGADVVFAPSVEEVYPGSAADPRGAGPQVRVAAGPMGERFEGAYRPGHFDGMLTVVAKLLHLTSPDISLYGQKDAQQLALIRRMVRDLNFPVQIVGVPTVREPDGLALSSRNRYLSPAERESALALSRALFAARGTIEGGGGADAALAAARAVLEEAAHAEPPLGVDYLALIDPADFTELTARDSAAEPTGAPGAAAPAAREDLGEGGGSEAVLAVAARVGSTRLIDNVTLPMELLGVRP
ncbi:pantoate--beta-alanine ligase [Streptomyces sp. WMMB 714]|uniref:pantoate--beta-alanine ligase n=1 Tax=Streptomyces sp. WMMB 714 TaxID=1286822 RepID=UPI000823BEAD|nr:pantoate--beta-alanine ligase [Streptomyces sp. WMMB 714]SCK45176.1 pantoate--beta-alanine ligase [Streptomyces sp. WMMB 714]